MANDRGGVPERRSSHRETILEKTTIKIYFDAAGIRGYKNHYKIKLRSLGYRLVYEVEEKEIGVYVICTGRRDRIYKILKKRKSNLA
jgi:mRNA interferase RelE/StbE